MPPTTDSTREDRCGAVTVVGVLCPTCHAPQIEQTYQLDALSACSASSSVVSSSRHSTLPPSHSEALSSEHYAQYREMEKQIIQLKTDLAEEKDRNGHISQSNVDLRRELSDLQQKHGSLLVESNKTKADLEASERQNGILQNINEKLTGKTETLKKEIEQLVAEANTMRVQRHDSFGERLRDFFTGGGAADASAPVIGRRRSSTYSAPAEFESFPLQNDEAPTSTGTNRCDKAPLAMTYKDLALHIENRRNSTGFGKEKPQGVIASNAPGTTTRRNSALARSRRASILSRGLSDSHLFSQAEETRRRSSLGITQEDISKDLKYREKNKSAITPNPNTRRRRSAADRMRRTEMLQRGLSDSALTCTDADEVIQEFLVSTQKASSNDKGKMAPEEIIPMELRSSTDGHLPDEAVNNAPRKGESSRRGSTLTTGHSSDSSLDFFLQSECVDNDDIISRIRKEQRALHESWSAPEGAKISYGRLKN